MVKSHAIRLPLLASALMFFYGFLIGGIQFVIADVAAAYHVGTAGMGLLVSAQYLAAIAAPVCAGLLADRIGKKHVLTAFTAIFCIGCTVAGCSTELGAYIAGALLIGAGYSVCETLSSAVLGDLDREKGMQYINLAQGFLSVGAVVSPMLLRLCDQRLGTNWRLVFLICGAAFALLAVLLANTPFPPAARNADGVRRSGNSFFRSGTFACLFAAILLYVGLENGFGYFLNSLFAARDQGAQFSAYALSAYWAGMALSRLLLGMRSYSPGRMLRTCFATIAILFLLLILTRNGALSVVLAALTGMAYGPIWTTLVGCAATMFPDRSGSAIGLMSTGCALGGMLYPALTGAIAGRFSLPAAFVMLAATSVIGMLLCLSVREKR